jgi:hypothetical protein
MLTAVLLTCLPARNVPPTPREKARELLDATLDSAPGAQPEVAALARLRIGENDDVFDHKKSLEAVNSTFAAALGIPPEKTGRRENAQGMIARATVPLSLPDAVSMLKRIQAGNSADDEDPHYEAVEAAVTRLIEKKQIDEAIGLINSVGATGKYPFKAASLLFAALPPDDVRRPAIFACALSAYTLRPSADFGEFLVKHWKEIPKTTAEAAVGQMVTTILNGKDEGLNESLSAAKGSLTLHGRQNVELFDLMHVVRSIDPKRADGLPDRRPELKVALARFPNGRESMGQAANWSRSGGDPGPPDERGAELVRVFAELEKLSEDATKAGHITKIADLAKPIRNPSARLEFRTAVIGLASDEPEIAKSLLSRCIELLKDVKDPPHRAESWSAVALAAHQIMDDKLAREAPDHAFDDAEEIYKPDMDADDPNPGPRDVWPFTNACHRIMISGAKIFGIDSSTLLNRITDPDMPVFARVELAQALLDRPRDIWNNYSQKTKKQPLFPVPTILQ